MKSSISKHSPDSGHSFILLDAKIIFKGNYVSELNCVKDLAILIEKVIVNENSDSTRLNFK